jgi:hypothetical protein
VCQDSLPKVGVVGPWSRTKVTNKKREGEVGNKIYICCSGNGPIDVVLWREEKEAVLPGNSTIDVVR